MHQRTDLLLESIETNLRKINSRNLRSNQQWQSQILNNLESLFVFPFRPV